MNSPYLPQEDVAKVAASLTKAQRKALSERVRGSRVASKPTTAKAFYVKNLISSPSGVATATALGVAVTAYVRSHLLGEKP